MKIGRAIVRTSAAGTVVLLSAGSFILSFAALHRLALDNGLDPGLAWIFPTLVDGLIIVGSLGHLQDKLDREKRTLTSPLAVLVGGTAASIAVQVLYAHGPTVLSRTVAAYPPAALAIGWWLLMRMTRRELDRKAKRPGAAAPQAQPAAPATAVATAAPQARKHAAAASGQVPAPQAAADVRRRRAAGEAVSTAQIMLDYSCGKRKAEDISSRANKLQAVA